MKMLIRKFPSSCLSALIYTSGVAGLHQPLRPNGGLGKRHSMPIKGVI